MKIYAAVLATLVSTGAIAGQSQEICSVLADFTSTVAQARDNGVPMYAVQKEADKAGFAPESAKMVKAIVNAVYNGLPFRHMTPGHLRTWSYDTCTKG